MKKISSVFLWCIFVCIIVTIYRPWFSTGLISSGDMGFLYKSMLSNHTLFPFAWYPDQGNGLGGVSVPLLWIYFMGTVPVLLLNGIFGYHWSLIVRFAYLYPFLLIGFVSIYIFVKHIFPKNKLHLFSVLLYLINTYILMLIGGGQVQLALSYAIAPLVFLLIFLMFQKFRHPDRNFYLFSFIVGITIAMQILFDFRFTYITFTALFLYSIGFFIINVDIVYTIWKYWRTLLGFVIALCIPLLLHTFWLLPTLLIHSNPLTQLGTAYSTTNAVQYFSFAKFENVMGLLHPNWPENIFGLTHFMRPEFLLLPILAFASLLFITPLKKYQENKYVLFFALLGLLGIFLGKGANDPFGGIYLWMFNHIPGFVMFRDPTKWYLFVAISYAVLIPFTVGKIYEWLKEKNIFLKSRVLNIQNIFLFIVICYLLFLIRPAIFGQLGGTFQTHTLPQEYTTLEKFLSSQSPFSRVLWIPSLERFGYYSGNHPAVSAETFYNVTNVRDTLTLLNKPGEERRLQERSIKYIVVPYDAEEELFIKNREYDPSQYTATIKALQKIPWLTEIPGFGRIHVFALKNVKDQFWVANESSTKVGYTLLDPTQYLVTVHHAQKGDKLIFTDSYDSHWQLSLNNQKLSPIPFDNTLNSFVLPQNGNYTLTFYYTPQRWVNIGLIISGITAILLLGYILMNFIYLKRKA